MANPRNQRLPEEIYVRRRIAAVVAILVVVALLVWGLVSLAGGGDEEEDPEAAGQTTALTEPAETEETTEPEETTATTEPEETETSEPEETTTASEELKQSCSLSDLQITASSDQPTYGPDDSPTFYMTVTNPTAVDCEVDLSDNVLRFEVYDLASNQRVWADVDCNPSEGEGEETFEADSERHYQAVWSRTTSSPETCASRDPVSPGSYFLHGVIGQNASNSHTFNLR